MNNRFILLCLTSLLLLINADVLASISWRLINLNDHHEIAQSKVIRSSYNKSTPIDNNRKVLSSINKNLFGNKEVNNNEDPVSALSVTNSRLNVQLTGIIASNNPEKSLVIIAQNGKQQSYAMGDTISGSSAVIRRIEPQQVMIERAGSLESLMLEASETAQPDSSVSALKNVSHKLVKQPEKLLDYVAITPVQHSGSLQGYRLNPGKNAELFNLSGLNANDLAVNINGYDLRDNAQAAQFMTSISQQTQFTISVIRDEAEKEIVIDLNRL